MNTNNHRVLVVVAHPDDEVIGCGATLARHADNDDEVRIIMVADGEGARPGGYMAERIAARERAAEAAAASLGLAPPVCLGLPDNRLDAVPMLEVVQAIECEGLGYRPTIVYTHHGGDLNIDHRIVHQAVMTCFRPTPGSELREIRTFEVASSTGWASEPVDQGFRPRLFVDTTGALERKLEALRHYEDEMRSFPHVRSYEAIEALARWRGATVGLESAEAFDVIRSIWFAT